MNEAVEADAIEAAREVSPGFVPRRMVARSVKTHVIRGQLDGRRVVAKVLSNNQPHWRWYLSREIAIYRVFARRPPPVAIPTLVASDADRGVLLLEEQHGRLLGRGRMAASRVDGAMVATLVNDLLRISRWHEAPSEAELEGHGDVLSSHRGPRARPLPDPKATLAWLDACATRWSERGLLDRALGDLLHHRLSRPVQLAFAHGDMLLRNVLDGPVYFDWEFAGRYPLGWDIGLLWVGLSSEPRAALDRMIDGFPSTIREQITLCAVFATVRELEVRRVSLRQGPKHPLVRRMEQSLVRARQRWNDQHWSTSAPV